MTPNEISSLLSYHQRSILLKQKEQIQRPTARQAESENLETSKPNSCVSINASHTKAQRPHLIPVEEEAEFKSRRVLN